MEFFYETGIYIGIVTIATVVAGLVIYILITKIKLPKKHSIGQSRRDRENNEVKTSARSVGFLKPTRRHSKTDMESPETFIKIEAERSKFETEEIINSMDQVSLPELEPVRYNTRSSSEKPEMSEQDVYPLTNPLSVNAKEPQIVPPVFSSPGFEQSEEAVKQFDSTLSDLHKEDKGTEENRGGEGNSILDLFATEAEESTGMGSIAKEMEDIDISELLTEATKVLQLLVRKQ